ncbi:parapinopsin-like [Achroia grisella]|uniref:parapinopsin-like n=1 Tax=Achroia grisella TaxID=688607 RepID=UPI0027D33AC6|nr:parapinopsin-like [Achroia grisella]
MTSFSNNINYTIIKGYEEDFPLLMPKWGYVASAFVLFLIGFFGFFLNLMVILLMFKDRQLWTPLNIILFNLVCSDFSVSVLGNPFTLISALFHRWVFGHTMCVLYGFFMALLGITSITTLTVISFERYILVTRPLSSRHLSSRGAILSIIFIWTYSLALTTPPLMGWGNYVNEAANISCSVNWHEQSMNTLTYIMFLFALGQIVPLAVITYSYVNIIRTLKKNSQRLGRVSRAETRATAMVFIMIISFTVAWTPYSLFALMEQFATEGIISPGAGVIPALVAKSSICYDPLIYVGMNTQFRQSIKRIFGMHDNKNQSKSEKGHNNTTLSPTQKRSGTNEGTTRYNSTETVVSISSKKHNKDKKIIFNDDLSESIKTENRSYQKDVELCTIQENRSASDVEKSGNTIYEEDSCNNTKKFPLFGPSCKLFQKRSPGVTIIDKEHLIFSKNYSNRDYDSNDSDDNTNAYGNKGYVEHVTDALKEDMYRTENINAETNEYKNINLQKEIKPSFSLDLNIVSYENRKRKMSVESKFETIIQPKGFFKDSVIGKLFDNNTNQFKTYLCNVENQNNDSTDDDN